MAPRGIMPDRTTDRETPARSEIRQTIRGLLINGGAITPSGKILSYRYAELHTDALPEKHRKRLKTGLIPRVPPRDARPAFPAGREVKKSAVHIIPNGVIERLGYEVTRKDVFRFLVEGLSEDGMTPCQVINYDPAMHLGTAFNNFAKIILEREQIWGPYFELKKYTAGILRDIANSEGLGQIDLRAKNRQQPKQVSFYLI